MSQVIIVSNRLPVSVKKVDGKLVFSPSVGGLATGLSSYVNDKRSVWIGWPGVASDELDEQDKADIITELAKHNCSPVFLTQKQIDDYYNGFSNTVLWPLFHKMRPQDQPGKQRDAWYRTYRSVNKLFAETVEVAAQTGAKIWVQDYQLMLVPEMLRDLKLDATIGYFHHIPFVDTKKYLSLPEHKSIAKGLLGADLIGFHTPGYVENFLASCRKMNLGIVGDQTLTYDDRVVRVSDFPMGIDYEKYASSGKLAVVKDAMKKFKKQYKGMKLIVAVDRMDLSKGLPERLKAYSEFLKRNPKLHGKVVFAMVAAPSRTDVPAYQRLAKRLDQLVAEINGAFGTKTWQPVDYINRTVPFEEVTALFRIADVAFIAPLRDGMNLAAKEFVASAHKNSVLILSEKAGAAEELKDALIVNPHVPETVIQALHDSLTMRRWQLRHRLRRMKNYLKVHTVQSWAKDFVTTLNKPIPGTLALARLLTRKTETQLIDAFKSSSRRLLLLDYDGSLVPFVKDFKKADPPAALMQILGKLSTDPANDVVIISGRSASDLDRMFGTLPINLIAEHGSTSKVAGGEWLAESNKDLTWKQILLPTLEKYAALIPGSKVNVKDYSLVWHYRASPPYYAQKYRVIISRALKPVLKEYGLEILRGNKVLEIKNPAVSKGRAASVWLERRHDFVMAVGDDLTDEDMFKELPVHSYGIKVGRGLSAAPYRVHSYRDVVRLLGKLT